MSIQIENSLRVLVRTEGGRFIAECVDFDLFGYGETADAAFFALCRDYAENIVVARHVGATPLDNLRRTDPVLLQMWEAAASKGRVEHRSFPEGSIPSSTPLDDRPGRAIDVLLAAA